MSFFSEIKYLNIMSNMVRKKKIMLAFLKDLKDKFDNTCLHFIVEEKPSIVPIFLRDSCFLSDSFLVTFFPVLTNYLFHNFFRYYWILKFFYIFIQMFSALNKIHLFYKEKVISS